MSESFAWHVTGPDSQKSDPGPNSLPVDSQIGPERSKQARTDIVQPTFPACLLIRLTLDGSRKRLSTMLVDHSEIIQNAKKVCSKASVCSCHVDFQGDILHGLKFLQK